MVGQNYFKGEDKRAFGGGGQKYIKYNIINNNSENFRRGKFAACGPLSCGPDGIYYYYFLFLFYVLHSIL